jgi:hypothetical protein
MIIMHYDQDSLIFVSEAGASQVVHPIMLHSTRISIEIASLSKIARSKSRV